MDHKQELQSFLFPYSKQLKQVRSIVLRQFIGAIAICSIKRKKERKLTKPFTKTFERKNPLSYLFISNPVEAN